jgi:hypothetical protein
VEASGWATESGLWNSSPEIFQQDLAAGFLVPTCFKCASFTLPTELESRRCLDNSTFHFLCPSPMCSCSQTAPKFEDFVRNSQSSVLKI